MELRQVEYVVAVVDHGSFTAGAAALGVAQPSLSESVRRLEDELGVRLFHRVGRRVDLTDAGRAFEGPARQLLRDRAQALDAVGSVRGLEAGTLEIVSLPTLAVDPLSAYVGRFRVAHPGITVRITEPEDARAVEQRVADGRSELGLAELPPKRDDLVEIALATQELVAVCPPGTNLPTRGEIRVAELAHMPLIATPAGTSTRDLLDDALARAGVTATVAVETQHREAIAPLVRAGAGTSFLPEAIARGLTSQGVVVARISPPLVRTIGLLHRATPLTPAARAFVELARAPERRRARH